jgi:hypothetical protein
MPNNWDEDFDDMETAADLFERDPRSEMVTVWMVDGETDAVIVSDLLEEGNVVAALIPASEAGKFAALGPPDWIHIQVCEADTEAAIDLLAGSDDVPGKAVVLEQDTLFEEEDTDSSEPE